MKTPTPKTNSLLFKIEINRKFPSMNKWLSGQNFKRRMEMKHKYKSYFKKILTDEYKHLKTIENFEVLFLCNSKYDIDNNLPVVKLFVDALRELGMILEDSTLYYKKLTIQHTDSLPLNHGTIFVYGNYV